ncbi:acetyl-CoA carboxylase biotin carboxyl carrier protein [Lactobacillus nasalidis]|uniref:acetyl-CoA carboxylase biotin carboxyl carrier protein n=1 Tax=Lactobacillus nasalidis TaxID=2797258 RepID=UPI001916A850|nr:acetyl-CoA carboxylase biotin carboxyl carrier protein [Lactobacillus nasalidis]
MEITDVEKLMDRFEKSSIREMNLSLGDLELFLSKNEVTQGQPAPAPAPVREEPAASGPAPSSLPAPAAKEAEGSESGHAIKSPLVGTIYLQAKPDQPPFVKVGDRVAVGQTVCIVEAMKMMTEIKSDVAGIVREVCVENEDLVECEQTLFLIEEA